MLTVTRQELATIPCLILHDARFEVAPLIIVYHGWTQSKGSVDTPDRTYVELASVGFVVVAPDCYEHGERKTEAWSRVMLNGWAFICEAMDQTRREAPGLLDASLGLPNVTPQRPQVAGVSMGGVIAQMVFAESRPFVSLVSVVGRSSFYQADPWCRRAQAGTWADAWCAQHATQSHAERFTDRPLLFIDGAKDTDCPPDVDAQTVKLINQRKGKAEQFVDLASGHAFSPTMRRRMVDWLVAHGQPPGSADADPSDPSD